MAANNRTHTGAVGDSMTGSKLAPKHLTKEEFARRLYNQMLSKGWSQSEFARRADLPRDSISNYMRGQSLPTPQNLKKLAVALDVDSDALLPNHIETAIAQDAPDMEMKTSPGAPGKAWLRVNRLVTTGTALKVIELLNDDDATK